MTIAVSKPVVFICRFKAEDLEVQLSNELAGSLRQLKVLDKTCETFLRSSALTFLRDRDAVFICNDFCVSYWVYYLEYSCDNYKL